MTSPARGGTGALRRSLPFFVSALVCTVAGGLLAAATAYASTEKTAWATAYLVLVCGIAQAGIGAAMGWLSPRASRRIAWVAFVLFTLGNAAVLTGQLAGILAATFAGGVLLVVALVLVVVATRRTTTPAHPAVLWCFRVLVILLAVSIPTGLVLAAIGR